MSTFISMLLGLLVGLSKMFCKYLPPGLHCLFFVGEPDFSVLEELDSNN